MKTNNDLVSSLGVLALASRFRRIAELLQENVGHFYSDMGIQFEPRWFTMVYALYHNKTMPVTKLAEVVGLTHPAVIHFANELKAAGLLKVAKDKTDSRRKMLSLSAKGIATFEKIIPLLNAIEKANERFIAELDTDLLQLLAQLETALSKQSMYDRVTHEMQRPIVRKPSLHKNTKR